MTSTQILAADPMDKARTVFAVARIGDVRIGVPSASVVQVVPRPPHLMKLPRRSHSIEGLFLHAGRLIPVVRLDRWIEAAGGPPVDERILVLRDAGRLIGLLVDSVMGVRRLAAADRVRIHRDDDAEELFQSAAVGNADETTLSLLEVGRLMALADVWCDEGGVEPNAEGDIDECEAPLPAALAGRKVAYASFRIGDIHAAIQANDVGELIARPPLQHGLPLQSEARGIIKWRGRFVPVVDLTRAIGSQVDPTPARWVCIVRQGEHAIGVLVHEVAALLAVDTADFASKRDADEPGLIFGAVVSEATRTVQLIDTRGLMQLYPEVAISSRTGAELELDDRLAARCTASAFMVFEAGTPFASPIQAVQEVIELPAALATRMDAGVPTSVEWRGHVVPLVDLRGHDGTGTGTDLTFRQLVIIADGDQRAAVAIGGVRALVPARAAKRRRFPTGNRGLIDMVSVDTPGHQASYAVLDLKQFVGS